jgi:cytochrome c oxidase assembly factor CtaG
MNKSSLLNPRFKSLEHIIELILVVVAIILTVVYLNMGIRPSRSEIMIIPIVRMPRYVQNMVSKVDTLTT